MIQDGIAGQLQSGHNLHYNKKKKKKHQPNKKYQYNKKNYVNCKSSGAKHKFFVLLWYGTSKDSLIFVLMYMKIKVVLLK